MEIFKTYTAFDGETQIATGNIRKMLSKVKKYLEQNATAKVLIFEDQTGDKIDFDFSGTLDEIYTRLSIHPLFSTNGNQAPLRVGPGRPKLGVISHEVTLLPLHWEWLGKQPGGASVALRKLIDESLDRGKSRELARLSWDAVAKFMSTMADMQPNFEEAMQALYAKDQKRLLDLTTDWPRDIRKHLEILLKDSMRYERIVNRENRG